jgi:hypothetical protein
MTLVVSLVATEVRIGTDILVKSFVGYGLFEPALDHSTLDRFELWVFRHCPDLFFNEVLRLVDRLCPEGRYSVDSKGGWDFRFPARLCRDCPLWNKCRGPTGKGLNALNSPPKLSHVINSATRSSLYPQN